MRRLPGLPQLSAQEDFPARVESEPKLSSSLRAEKAEIRAPVYRRGWTSWDRISEKKELHKKADP